MCDCGGASALKHGARPGGLCVRQIEHGSRFGQKTRFVFVLPP
uniref:Uncharacterized protein n=1 Tax=Paracidobacterium acidisoli TaxID=2303751 RepID=A0A372IPZ5_9BACT